MLGRNGWLAATAGVIVLAQAAWCDDAAPPVASELKTWVAQLNDDDYAVREEAARRLTEAGPAAIAELVEGIASDQAEVAWRSGAALERIGLEGNDDTVEQIIKHLDAACAKTGRQGLKLLATELYARQKQFRRERAVAQIRKHGGNIAGSGIDGDAAGIAGGFLPFAGPAIIFDGPVVEMEAMALPVPVEIEPELPRAEVFDLFAEVGRVLGRAIVPGGGAKPAVEAAPADAAPTEPEAAPRPDEPAEKAAQAAEAAAKDAATELGKAVEEATKAVERAVEEAAKEVPVEGSEPAPIADEKGAEPAVDEPAPAVAVEVAFAGIGFAEMAVAVDGGMETGQWAQLALDSNWRGGDEGLSVLKDLPELTQVDFNQTKLTDKALVHLAGLPKLQQLNVYQAGFSRDGLLKFHRQRPTVVVYSRGDAMMGINGDLNSSPLVLTMVQNGSGAAQAGLQVGDVVHEIDGVKIRDFSDLTICVAFKQPGEKIAVEYEREGKKHSVQVPLSRRTE